MPTGTPFYRAIAKAMVAEGVTAHFTLMGDANMHFATALAEEPGVDTIHIRHEHCAVAAAMAWSGATGKVGLASVTCGPGFTQVMTALGQASRNRVPVVVFAGEVPMHKTWYGQSVDQAALASAMDAHYVQAHSRKTIMPAVQRAFHLARHERRPVVLGIPYDLQKEPFEGGDYLPSTRMMPKRGKVAPDPEALEGLTEALATAKRPIILAGRGVIASGAAQAVEELAEASGALLATTLPAMGLFDDNPWCIGVSGGFGKEYARELAGQADLVVAFGASLSSYTLDSGDFYGKARVVQVDLEPSGHYEGMWSADDWIVADAGLTAAGLTAGLSGRAVASEMRTQDVAAGIARDVQDSGPRSDGNGLIDPRTAAEAIDQALPKDFELVSGSGHSAYWHAIMRGYPAGGYHVYKNFGAIGSGLSFAIGATVAKKSDRICYIEGDGSLMMHIQELDTIRRHKLKMLILVMNDGAYGSEIHKLRVDGLDDRGAIHGHADFESIAKGFGLRGATVTDAKDMAAAIAAYDEGDTTMIVNVMITDQVATPRMRKMTAVPSH